MTVQVRPFQRPGGPRDLQPALLDFITTQTEIRKPSNTICLGSRVPCSAHLLRPASRRLQGNTGILTSAMCAFNRASTWSRELRKDARMASTSSLALLADLSCRKRTTGRAHDRLQVTKHASFQPVSFCSGGGICSAQHHHFVMNWAVHP